VLVVSHAGLLYAAERELGADGARLGNLDGVALELELADKSDPPDLDLLGPLSDIARLCGRVALLTPDQATVPGQI
jgi:hypothetical protein